MSRSRSPRAGLRVALLKDLRTARHLVDWLKDGWTVRGMLYAPPDGEARTPRANWVLRERRLDEYPENNPKRWRDVEAMMRALARLATEIADSAAGHARDLEKGKSDAGQ